MDLKASSIKVSVALFYAFLAYTLLLIIPVSFQATMPYLDSSWGYDLNYFLHSRFHFGPDLIFTYGPLGFLNNPQHVGHHIELAFAVHAVFWIVLAVQLSLIWKSGLHSTAVMLCLGLVLSHKLYCEYWDLFLVSLCLITLAKLFRRTPCYLDMLVLPVLIGVTFLVKFTAFSTIGLMLAVYTAHITATRRLQPKTLKLWLLICYLSPIGAFLIYDPSLVHLGLYIKSSIEIASGFTSAMSSESAPRDIMLAGIAVLLITLKIAFGLWQRCLFWTEAMMAIVVLWSTFRQGFVRGDASHVALFFGYSILTAAFCLAGYTFWPVRPMGAIAALFFVAVSITCLSGMSKRYPVLTGSNWLFKQSLADIGLLMHRQTLMTSLDHSFDGAFASLPGMAFRSSIEGNRVLVFPHGTPYVAKINFEMFPNYTVQDYASNTPYLDKKAAHNLLFADPPVDKVLFEWLSIDDRNLIVDTPAITMAFLSGFIPEAMNSGALLLHRRQNALNLQSLEIGHEMFRPEEWVEVPYREQLVTMSIALSETIPGKIVTGLYRQEPVYIDLEPVEGPVRRYRVPPRNLSTPGTINYVPQSLEEFEKLWASELLRGRIRKVRLSGPGLRWSTSSGYYFYELQNAGVRLAK